jgi:hypothetical protein
MPAWGPRRRIRKRAPGRFCDRGNGMLAGPRVQLVNGLVAPMRGRPLYRHQPRAYHVSCLCGRRRRWKLVKIQTKGGSTDLVLLLQAITVLGTPRRVLLGFPSSVPCSGSWLERDLKRRLLSAYPADVRPPPGATRGAASVEPHFGRHFVPGQQDVQHFQPLPNFCLHCPFDVHDVNPEHDWGSWQKPLPLTVVTHVQLPPLQDGCGHVPGEQAAAALRTNGGPSNAPRVVAPIHPRVVRRDTSPARIFASLSNLRSIAATPFFVVCPFHRRSRRFILPLVAPPRRLFGESSRAAHLPASVSNL